MIWKTAEFQVCWYCLIDERHKEILPANGVLRSIEFDGFCLDVATLIKGGMKQVMSTLNPELERKGYWAHIIEY